MKLFTWNEELEMAKKGFTPEKIVALLRQVEVLIGQGKSTPVALTCRLSSDQWNLETGALLG